MGMARECVSREIEVTDQAHTSFSLEGRGPKYVAIPIETFEMQEPREIWTRETVVLIRLRSTFVFTHTMLRTPSRMMHPVAAIKEYIHYGIKRENTNPPSCWFHPMPV
jgi:hypothetical protein